MRNPYSQTQWRPTVGQRARNRMFRTIYRLIQVNCFLKTFCVLLLVGPPVAILLLGYFGGGWKTLTDEAPVQFLYLDTYNDTQGTEMKTWAAVGWDYHHTLESVVSSYAVTAENVMHGRDDEDNDGGYWVSGSKERNGKPLGYWVLGTVNRTVKEESFLGGTGITGNSSNEEGVLREYKKVFLEVWGFQRHPTATSVSLGLTLYLEGNAYLRMTYFDKYGIRFRINKREKGLKTVESFNTGFCSIIVEIPESAKNIEKILIEAKFGDDSPKSIIIIDKVVVTFGETTDRSMTTMYSMIPDNWCRLRKNKSRRRKKRIDREVAIPK